MSRSKVKVAALTLVVGTVPALIFSYMLFWAALDSVAWTGVLGEMANLFFAAVLIVWLLAVSACYAVAYLLVRYL